MVDERSREPFRSGPTDDRPPPASKARNPAAPTPRRRFWPTAALAALGLVAAVGSIAALLRPDAAPGPSVSSSGEAAIGGPFHLIGVDGRPVDQRILLGKWSAVFFGYTNCPDTCPATLQALNAAAATLGARRKALQVVFISVDPARDTPAQMKLYTDSQGYPPGGLIGLTGTAGQVKAVADAYHAFYSKAGSGPDYEVQHSAAVYLMDPAGRFVKPLDETQPPAVLAKEIASAMRS